VTLSIKNTAGAL